VKLVDFGWDKDFEERFKAFSEIGLQPARVTEANRLVYKLIAERGELMGKLSGRFRHSCQTRGDYPTVGDWVAYKPTEQKGFVAIQGLVERKSRFMRKAAGKTSEEQVIAANVDTVFIVSGLDQDYNIRRLERYVTLASEGNSEYVFILNKADLRKDVEKLTSEIKNLFGDVPVYAISALQNLGLEQIAPHITAGKTVVFLGSSGVGKSSIINRLLGEEKQKTGHVSSHDGRGRHITTSKNLILLPNGAIVVDTPGLRELSMLCTGEGLKNAFSDIEEYAKECKYRTCTHTNEPGCAVLAAVEEGRIEEGRIGNYRKLRKEIAYNLTKHDARYRTKRSSFWKNISKQAKAIKKSRE
jgi:ribosome biogenesis GTPase